MAALLDIVAVACSWQNCMPALRHDAQQKQGFSGATVRHAVMCQAGNLPMDRRSGQGSDEVGGGNSSHSLQAW